MSARHLPDMTVGTDASERVQGCEHAPCPHCGATRINWMPDKPLDRRCRGCGCQVEDDEALGARPL